MELKPFKAFRFDASVVGDVGSCISPPYDIISDAQRKQLYQKNEYNVVRIIKGKKTTSDSDNDNQYTRAADYLNSWIAEGVLKQDVDETIYAYVQDFQAAGRNFQRSSFIALAKLEELGTKVIPHEKTLSGPKIDRLNLQKATGAKFGQVFLLYKDEQRVADKIIEKTAGEKPYVDFVDEQDVRHRLFTITAKEDIDAIAKMMADKTCVIADGHHRYSTALNYYKETADPAARYQMLTFANTCNEGMIVLATHRVVSNLKNFEMSGLLAGLKNNFEIKEHGFDSPQAKTDAKQMMLADMKAAFNDDKNAFGVYGGGEVFYLAVLKNQKAMDSVAPDMSVAWKSLDVAVLHKLILEQLLGIDESKLASQSNIDYIKDTAGAIDDSIENVDNGQKQVAFFMNPPKMEQIQDVAAEGETMPQKSTYFYPKIFTGLTIYKL